jgi:hypothetical protein
MKSSPTVSIDIFIERSRHYARLTRMVSTDMRDLHALRTAYTWVTDHSGQDSKDLKDAIESMEHNILFALHYHGYDVGRDE